MDRSQNRFGALFLLTFVLATACTPQETVRISPSPTRTAAATTPAPTTPAPTPSRTASPAPTSAAPTPTTAPTTSPGSTPAAACPTLTGGSPLAGSILSDVRAAHQPGFDRLVFEWNGPSVPQYEIKVASSFTGPSGLPVPVSGNAFISVRMTGQAHTNTLPVVKSYPEPDPFQPALPLIRQVKSVEDFEGTVIFGVGLERLACPTVLTLLSPSRIVLDFPTPP